MKIQVEDGMLEAFVAEAAKPDAPVVLVLHELFGVNQDIRTTCRELSSRGFTAIAPPLFWREAPGLDLNSWSDADWKKGFELYGTYDFNRGVRDIAAVIAAARALTPGTRVGVMGFCLGGLMTFLTLAGTDADAGVAYYPGGIEQHLAEAPKVRAPMIIHLGTSDEYISPAAQEQVKQAFAGRHNVQIFTYEGMSHAFARHTGTHYDAHSAAIANDQTYLFLASQLGAPASAATSRATA